MVLTKVRVDARLGGRGCDKFTMPVVLTFYDTFVTTKGSESDIGKPLSRDDQYMAEETLLNRKDKGRSPDARGLHF